MKNNDQRHQNNGKTAQPQGQSGTSRQENSTDHESEKERNDDGTEIKRRPHVPVYGDKPEDLPELEDEAEQETRETPEKDEEDEEDQEQSHGRTGWDKERT